MHQKYETIEFALYSKSLSRWAKDIYYDKFGILVKNNLIYGRYKITYEKFINQ